MAGEYIRGEAEKIYDQIKRTGGIYITPESELWQSWREDLSFGKRQALRAGEGDSSLTLDHWADKFDLWDYEIIEKLAEADPPDEREVEYSYDLI